jgi:hypothetical protein
MEGSSAKARLPSHSIGLLRSMETAMPSRRYPETGLMIGQDELVEYASLGVLKNAAAAIPGLTEWVGGAVRKTPLRIYDINGQPLFYDVEVARGKEVLGDVRMAASKVMGAGAFATELGARRPGR